MKRKLISLLNNLFPSLVCFIRMCRFNHAPFKNNYADVEIKDYAPNISQDKISDLRKDIYSCSLKYETTPAEYFLMGFYNKDTRYRSSFLTDKFREELLRRVSKYEKVQVELNNKFNFYKLNSQYFARHAMLCDKNAKEEFVSFVLSRKKVFIKPNNDSCGRGAGLYEIQSKEDAIKLYENLMSIGNEWIVEDYIIQDDEMSKWNPSSVNTVRIPAILTKKGFYVIAPFVRFGTNGSVVDNAGAGGVFANVDVKTGRICTLGIDEFNRQYKVHPSSGIPFIGWQVPKWDELLALVEKVHRENMPSHIYIGWDFALTKNGWVLIEGNWGQLVSQYADKKGRKKEFVQLIKQGSLIA